MHVPADAVPDQRADDREPGVLDVPLYRRGDIAQMVAGPRLIGAREERSPRRVEELASLRLDRADGNRLGGIGDPAVLGDPHVQRDHVAPLERVWTRNSVDDHRVGRRADRPGKAAVALERGRRALGGDEPVRGLVELGRRDAWVALRAQHLEAAGLNRSGRRHLVDLLGGLADDHRGRE